ncbi:L-histidine N(alpha)-methyltransferase [Streptomyces phaeochromogenes]|uniref:L-histidine N(alpha)-methyltransferase n=1 Tax=Streptomyces phaeochromogenes TaxID=1923 RepID=UPI00367B70D5
MKYLTNRQITDLYKVSFDAVRKWINAAREGKNELQIALTEPDKWQIADTSKNHEIMKGMVARGKTRKNRLALKMTDPKPEFYELYSPAQQLDIISSIETYREIPLQYGYFDGGAEYWDKYANRLLNEQSANMLNKTVELIASNLANLDRLIGNHKRVNVIDLGVGNGLPVKGLLDHLLKRGVLNRYVGIDLSHNMLEIAKQNIDRWFDGKVSVETYARDMTTERFKDLLVADYDTDTDKPLNIVTLLGATLLNLRDPEDMLRLVRASMMPDDVLVYTTKLDTANARRYFDFNTGEDAAMLADDHRMVIELLGIDPSMYEPEQFYDAALRSRLIRIRLKLDVTVRFKRAGGEWRVELNRNDTITLWRAWHLTARETVDQFDQSGLRLLDASVTPDDEYLITISRPSIIKPNRG